jgi:hypothetical protein
MQPKKYSRGEFMNQIRYENIIDDLINEKLVLQSEIESLQSLLQYWDLRKEEIIGKRIRLISTTDEHTIVKPNDCGVISHVDDAGTIFANWDNGSTLGLIPGIDFFEVL